MWIYSSQLFKWTELLYLDLIIRQSLALPNKKLCEHFKYSSKTKNIQSFNWIFLFDIIMAEEQGFEPWRPFGLPVFKTGAFNRSAIPPWDPWARDGL